MKTLNKEICKELGAPQYVKRPIPAYAIQIIPENQVWLEQEERLNLEAKTIQTLEGTFHFDLGDYLIIGNDDEVWTIKKKIFEDTYMSI